VSAGEGLRISGDCPILILGRRLVWATRLYIPCNTAPRLRPFVVRLSEPGRRLPGAIDTP